MDMMSREREVRREREGWKGRENGSVGKRGGDGESRGKFRRYPEGKIPQDMVRS